MLARQENATKRPLPLSRASLQGALPEVVVVPAWRLTSRLSVVVRSNRKTSSPLLPSTWPETMSNASLRNATHLPSGDIAGVAAVSIR